MAITLERLIYNMALDKVGEYYVDDDSSTTTKQYILCNRNYSVARDEVLVSHLWNEAMKSVIIVSDSADPIFGYDHRYSKPSDALRIVSVDSDVGSDQRNDYSGVYAWEVEGDYILSNGGVSPQTWADETDYVDGEFVETTPVTWATGTAYIDGQYITDGTDVYEVLSNHTSSTIAADVTSGYLGTGVEGTYCDYEVATTHTSTTVAADIALGYITPAGVDKKIVFVKYVYQLTDTTAFSPKLKQAIALKLAIKVITGLTNDTKGKIDLINEFEKLVMPQARSVDGMQGSPKPIFNSEWIRSRSSGTM